MTVSVIGCEVMTGSTTAGEILGIEGGEDSALTPGSRGDSASCTTGAAGSETTGGSTASGCGGGRLGTGGCAGSTRLFGLTAGAGSAEGNNRCGLGDLARGCESGRGPSAWVDAVAPTRSDPAAKLATGIPSASTLSRAWPAASASPPGTTTDWSHRGHLSVRPARSSGTISVCPVGHLIRSGIPSVCAAARYGSTCSPIRPLQSGCC